MTGDDNQHTTLKDLTPAQFEEATRIATHTKCTIHEAAAHVLKRQERDPFQEIKEAARTGKAFVWPLPRPELRIYPKRPDAISIELIEWITDKHPEITTGELIEQMQNAINWMYQIDILSQHQGNKLPMKERTVRALKRFAYRLREMYP